MRRQKLPNLYQVFPSVFRISREVRSSLKEERREAGRMATASMHVQVHPASVPRPPRASTAPRACVYFGDSRRSVVNSESH